MAAVLQSRTTNETAPNPVMEVQGLNFFYGAFQGLKNVTVDLARNHVTAFIGPSGCGKSTLLRTFNRMFDLYPGQRAEGRILLNGKDILSPDQDVNLLRARVGMVFQKPTPFPMTIRENIAFGVRLYERMSNAAMNERVEWALRKAALWDEVKDKLYQSGLSVCRAASSSGSASRARWRSSRRSCCSTSRPARSTRSPPPRSRN